jgi:hypothetical protein
MAVMGENVLRSVGGMKVVDDGNKMKWNEHKVNKK